MSSPITNAQANPAQAGRGEIGSRDAVGSTLINHWQRGVPVYREPVVTPSLIFFGVLAVLGLVLAAVRFFSPLGPFSAT